MKMTMKVSKGEYRKILSAFSDKTALDIRHICSAVLYEDLAELLEIDRDILDAELVAAGVIPETQLKTIYKRMMSDLQIFNEVPITEKMLKGDFSGLGVNKENAIALSQVTDEISRPAYPLWKRQSAEKQPENPSEGFWFDEEKSIAHYKGKTSQLPFKGLEHYLLKIILESPPEKPITETKIIEALDAARCKADGERIIYDTHRRLNTRLKSDLGIERFIEAKKANYWRII